MENDSFCHKFRLELRSFLQKRTGNLMADRSHRKLSLCKNYFLSLENLDKYADKIQITKTLCFSG